MQNYSMPYLQSPQVNAGTMSYLAGTTSAATSAAHSDSASTTPKSGGGGELELGLGWSSRNPVSSNSQKQHQLQRARAANTLSSLSHTGSTPSTSQVPALPDYRDGNRKRAKSGQSDRDRRYGQHSIKGHQGSMMAPTGAVASVFGGPAEEYDEEDELGGGSSRYNTAAASYHSDHSSNRPTSQPIPGGTDWDSAEARDATGSGGTRKQNSACDACRNRKVRCNRMPGEEKCAHCKTKGIECTTVFVQLATTGPKRPGKRARQSTEGPTDGTIGTLQSEGSTSTLIRYLISREAEYPNAVRGLSYTPFPGEEHRVQPTTAAESRLANATARMELVSDLIETYFSIVHTRYPILDPIEFRRRFHTPSADNGGPPADVLVAVILAWGAKFSENPILVADRKEAATQLTPTQKRKREAATPANSAAHVAIAAPVQQGAREREQERRARARGNGEEIRVIGRSRIAEDLVIKAQEVLDRNKVHRVSSLDNIRAALIVEALFWRPSHDSVGGQDELGTNNAFRKRRGLYVCDGAWVSSAIWHLKELRVHQQETIDRIADPAQRPQVAMCWWLACMMDAHMSAFYRRKPYLALEDYTTDLPAPPPAPEQEGPHPLATAQGYQIWLTSSQQQVEMMRSVYYTLWTPQTALHGISARKLEKLASLAFAWRENHLALVGAPYPAWPPHWNFADAVTACASDMNYHIVWILMWEAIEEFGIAELKVSNASAYNTETSARYGSSPATRTKGEMELDQSKIRGLSARIYDEALNGALRSANLSQVLCDNGYLRLEAGIMKWSMAEAGFCLTKFKRPEVTSIIEALRQYGQAFEECYDQANELEQLASTYLHGETSTLTELGPATSSSTSFYLGGGDGASHFTSSRFHDSSTQQAATTTATTAFDYYSSPTPAAYGANRGGSSTGYLTAYGQATPYQQSTHAQQGTTASAFTSAGAGMPTHQSAAFF